MSDDEEYVPVPRNERSRKYIPLGNGSSQRKPKTHPDSSPQINSLGISGITNVTSSFCVDQPPRQVCKIPPPLPDIYTTCPELRTFKLAISLESIPKFNSIKPNLEGSTFDPNKKILKPYDLGFVPKSEWPPQNMSLNDLKILYFSRRNGAARQFDFKLYNALCITSKYPEAYEHVGAMWVSDSIMKISSSVFANLLGIHAIQGGLFHKQGNFSRHGFVHVYKQNANGLHKSPLCCDVDDYNVRLYTDRLHKITRGVFKYRE